MTRTHGVTLAEPTRAADVIVSAAIDVLDSAYEDTAPVRLLGVRAEFGADHRAADGADDGAAEHERKLS
ncbi:MAG: hypothetical protein M0030_28195 [Actinomycetota bacterium]|nr:hypothetical protein [Actinomycetota bacterium]